MASDWSWVPDEGRQFVESSDDSPIDEVICEIMTRWGPDRHIDGHEIITAYVERKIAAEREACAKIADEVGDTEGEHIAEKIRGKC